MADTGLGDALPDEPTTTIATAIPSVMMSLATPSLLLFDGGAGGSGGGGSGGSDGSIGEAEARAVTLSLDNKSFNIVFGCLLVVERAALAQSNMASAQVVQMLYKNLRDHPDAPLPLFKQFGVTNPVDLSRLRTPLTEESVELLVTGALGLGCCSTPTGMSFAGFAQPVHADRELPGFLVHVLSRLVVLRAGDSRIQGPLPALVARLPFHQIRVLDLQGCDRVTGDLSAFSGMKIEVLNLRGCRQVTGIYIHRPVGA